MAAVAEPTPTTSAPEGPVLNEKPDLQTESVEPTAASKDAEITVSEKSEAPIESGPAQETPPAAVEAAPAETAATTAVQATNPTAENAAPSGPVKVPPTNPLPQCKPAPQPELSADRKAKYEELLAIVITWTEIPTTSARNSPKEPLTDDERMWLTKDCLLRYLRATKWHVANASTRLLATLTWRREYGVAGFTADHVEPEQLTGKQLIYGWDNEARPCLYQDPSRQNTKENELQIHHMVYWLERAIDLMPPGQETLALLIDYKNSSSSKNPGVSTGRKVLNILQGHYPERLGKALISDRKISTPQIHFHIISFFSLVLMRRSNHANPP
jgi:hypothetical protein